MHPQLERLLKNTMRCFGRRALLFQASAIVLTAVIVTTGLDWDLFLFSRTHPHWQLILFPSVLLGGLVPVIAPGVLYVYGKKQNLRRHVQTALALGHAAVTGFLVSSLYKVFAGRVHPGPLRGYSLDDNSGAFRFGIGNGGIVDGWPSGHTTIAVAMSIVIITRPGVSQTIRALALAYCLYIGLGVATSIHWFSDFVAGALIGTGAGLVVSRDSLTEIPR